MEKSEIIAQYPIRSFDLESLGINTREFCRIFAPTFYVLPWDRYDVRLRQIRFLQKCLLYEKENLEKLLPHYYAGLVTNCELWGFVQRLSEIERNQFNQMPPFRQRSVAQFRINFTDTDCVITNLPIKPYVQRVELTDYRSIERAFQETSKDIKQHPLFVQLLNAVALITKEYEPDVKALNIHFHQISVVTYADCFGEGAPEGIHQDGADYNVSAIVVERTNIKGGESIVYGPDKETEYLRTTLQVGQGLFHADSNSPLWHYVTPIHLDDEDAIVGRRSIFGFDVTVEK